MLNTALVVTMFVLIMPDMQVGGVPLLVAVPEMLISGAIECACMALLTPPISLTLERTVLGGRRAMENKSKKRADAEKQPIEPREEIYTEEIHTTDKA